TTTPPRIDTDAPGSADTPRRKANAPRRPEKGRTGKVLLGLLAWAIGLVFVTPLAWMLLTSLHAETDASTNPPSFFAPLTLESYVNFFGGGSGHRTRASAGRRSSAGSSRHRSPSPMSTSSAEEAERTPGRSSSIRPSPRSCRP